MSPFALVGGADNATTGVVTAALQCEHDNSNGANPYVDPDATFWAHNTNSLQLTTE
jgi:hypothetical protein